MTADLRAECERHRDVVCAALDPTSGDFHLASKARGAVLTKLILASPGAALTETRAQARGEAYQLALDDKPAWAIQEAIRRWYRREWGEREYVFAPEPADLRDLTDRVLAPYVESLHKVTDLLEAKSLEDAMHEGENPAARNPLVPQLRRMG